MKRFLAILLSALMIFSTMSVMAAEVEGTTNGMTVSYAGNGVFEIAGTLPETEGNYKLVVAQYDKDGLMLDVSSQAVTAADDAFSTTKTLSYAPAQTKFMLWEMNGATPCAEAVALPDEGGINIITAKTEVGTSTGGDISGNPLTNLVDGNDDTLAVIYGGAGRQGAMYVDLEKAYEIDRIEVLAYHNFYNRGSGFDVVLGNAVPDNTAFAEGAGEFKAGHADEDLTATSTAVGYKTFYVPANAGSYRYVSLETFDETDGLAVAEIKVYVKNVGEQIEYVSVTDRATSHKSSETATATSYETDPNNQLVDGDLSTSYGTGPANGAYYTFVDLGEGGRRVDKVVITVNDIYGPDRIKGQKYYLTNNVPVKGADRSEWVYLGTRINKVVPMTFILNEQQAGIYRYVVVDCTDAAVGGYVNEIEVYKDASIVEPVIAKNVAKKKPVTASHAGYSTFNNPNVITDGVFKSVDGNNQLIITTIPSTICIDLKGTYSIEKLVLDAVLKDEKYNFTVNLDVYTSDYPAVGNTIHSTSTKILSGSAEGWENSVKTLELDETVAGRYVIIQKTAKGADNDSFRLSEVEVYGIPVSDVEVVNVAYGKNAAYSQTPTISGYTNPAVITDGIFQAADANNQFIITKAPSTVCIDLGDTYSIEKLVMDAVLKNEKYNFTVNLDVYISDTPVFGDSVHPSATKVLAGSAEGWENSVKTLELDEAVAGRYVIIQKTAKGADNDSFRLSEIEAWGTLADGATYDYEIVKSSAEVTSYHAQLQNAGWALNPRTDVSTTVFTDNDPATRYGRGHGGDVAWIDLGEPKDIDAIRVEINDEYVTIPTAPMVFYMTNDNPLDGLKANTDADGYLTVPESWVSMNGSGHIWTTKNISEAKYVLAETGKYRYIIVTNPAADYNNDSVKGLEAYISEITPYVLVEK